MKRLTRSEIKAELEKPNGSAEIMNDSTIDKISLCDETTAMFIEENIGSALMIRLAKSRAMLLRMSGNPALLPAMRKALASDASPKLRRNAARLIGLFTKDEADAQLLIARLKMRRYAVLVRPSLLFALGAVGGESAQRALDEYTPAPPADETEQKHYLEECEALKQARTAAMKHEKHIFRRTLTKVL